jgi:D-alanyl-D-alanine carboxypeptidase
MRKLVTLLLAVLLVLSLTGCSQTFVRIGEKSEIYTEEALMEAVVQIKCRFATWEGCELHSIRYAGDETNLETNIARMNAIAGEDKYVECAEFLMDFHTQKVRWEWYYLSLLWILVAQNLYLFLRIFR